jgi:hypothetical protein
MVSPQESRLKDVYVLYDEDRDKLYQHEDGVVITYTEYDRAYYWENVLNENVECNYEAMESMYLPDHQIDRLYNQLTKSNKQTT